MNDALKTWLGRLGWPGLAGLAMLAAGLWMERGHAVQLDAQAARIASAARALRHQLQDEARQRDQAAKGGMALIGQRPPQEVWAFLWENLPGASRRIAMQGQVLQSAKEMGIAMNTVRYRGQGEAWSGADGGRRLWRQTMVMPVEAPYGAVRAWMRQLLAEPALSLDAVDIQRADLMSDTVKAQVTVSLWWRQEGGRP